MLTATKRKPRSLQQQLESPDAQHRIWIEDSFPDAIMHSWCSATITLVESDPTLQRRVINWVKQHARCGYGTCEVEVQS